MRPLVRLLSLLLALSVACTTFSLSHAQDQVIRPAMAVLLEKLCAQTPSIRANEFARLKEQVEKRAKSVIRSTGLPLSIDLIDDAVQESLIAIRRDCAQMSKLSDLRRISRSMTIIRNKTIDQTRPYVNLAPSDQIPESTSFDDLADHVTSAEFDLWLESLSPDERAVALLSIDDDLEQDEIAQIAGLADQPAVSKARKVALAALQNLFRGDNVVLRPFPKIEKAAVDLQNFINQRSISAFRITGLSSSVYFGWSLIASVDGLGADETLAVSHPFVLDPEDGAYQPMIVTDVIELPTSRGPRKFLLKAYCAAEEKKAPTLQAVYRSARPVENTEALQVLSDRRLSNIEKTRCLWSILGKGNDPGLCK